MPANDHHAHIEFSMQGKNPDAGGKEFKVETGAKYYHLTDASLQALTGIVRKAGASRRHGGGNWLHVHLTISSDGLPAPVGFDFRTDYDNGHALQTVLLLDLVGLGFQQR